MDSDPSRRSGWEVNPLSTVNVLIETLNLAKEESTIGPAKTAFGEVSAFLAIIFSNPEAWEPQFRVIGDSSPPEIDYVYLGLFCADICRSLDRGLNGRRCDELSQSVLQAIEELIV